MQSFYTTFLRCKSLAQSTEAWRRAPKLGVESKCVHKIHPSDIIRQMAEIAPPKHNIFFALLFLDIFCVLIINICHQAKIDNRNKNKLRQSDKMFLKNRKVRKNIFPEILICLIILQEVDKNSVSDQTNVFCFFLSWHPARDASFILLLFHHTFHITFALLGFVP